MASIKMGGGVVQGVVQWVWVVRWVVLTISIGICPTQSAHPCPRGRIRWAPCRWTVVSLACLFCGGWFRISARWVGIYGWFSGSMIGRSDGRGIPSIRRWHRLEDGGKIKW